MYRGLVRFQLRFCLFAHILLVVVVTYPAIGLLALTMQLIHLWFLDGKLELKFATFVCARMLHACQQGGVGKTSVLSTSKKRRRDFLRTTTRGPYCKLFHTLHRSEEIQTAHLQTPQIAESFISLRSVPRCSCSECGSQDPQALRLIPTLSALPANAAASTANKRCNQCMRPAPNISHHVFPASNTHTQHKHVPSSPSLQPRPF
jgi:hypothetical protein